MIIVRIVLWRCPNWFCDKAPGGLYASVLFRTVLRNSQRTTSLGSQSHLEIPTTFPTLTNTTICVSRVKKRLISKMYPSVPSGKYAFLAPVTARVGEGVAVLHSTRKHVRSNSLPRRVLTRSGPSKGHRVHKYYAQSNSVESLYYDGSEDHLFCNQCTFVRQEQLSHDAYGISKRDNISSRKSRTSSNCLSL